MKVLIVSHYLPYPAHGGSFQRTYNLYKESAKGNEVYFYSFTQDKFLKSDESRKEAIEHLSQYAKELKVFKTPIDISFLNFYWLLFLNIFSRKPYSASFFYSKELEEAIEGVLDKVDLVHFETIALAPYINLCKKKNVKVSLAHQNVESDLLLQRSKSETNILKKIFCYFQGKKLKFYEDEIIPLADLNITVTEDDKIRFQDRGLEAKFEVAENGTDISYFTPEDSTSKKNIKAEPSTSQEKNLVFAGTLDWHPNEDGVKYFLKDIFPLLLNKVPDVKFNIFGRSASESLTSLAKEYPSAKLHGFVDDVRPHILSAEVYVVPLRVGGGSRLKILDAMASGKAVVSTSIGAEGLEVEHKKNIFIADTPEDFAEAIEFLLNNEKDRDELSLNARKLVEEKYSWGKIAEGMVRDWGKL